MLKCMVERMVQMNTKAFETYESEVRSYCRNFPAVFTTAKGPFLYDEDGREYIDFFCGAGGLNYGHNNDYIKSRLLSYLESDGVMLRWICIQCPSVSSLNFMKKRS